jgi:hypothetical protein
MQPRDATNSTEEQSLPNEPTCRRRVKEKYRVFVNCFSDFGFFLLLRTALSYTNKTRTN